MKTAAQAQFGDFQTPLDLACQVTRFLSVNGVSPSVVVEPTCGAGNFLVASIRTFGGGIPYYGFDINPDHVNTTRDALTRQRGGSDASQMTDDTSGIGLNAPETGVTCSHMAIPLIDGGAAYTLGVLVSPCLVSDRIRFRMGSCDFRALQKPRVPSDRQRERHAGRVG